MKRFKNFQTIVEFSGDDLPPSTPKKYSVFQHKVYQLTENNGAADPDYHISSQDEKEYTHDLGNVVLPINDPTEANRILSERFHKFHLQTCLTHDHNHHSTFEDLKAGFADQAKQDMCFFGRHYHSDGKMVNDPTPDESKVYDLGHAYAHYLESSEMPTDDTESVH
jgi:hypothetical protein